MANPESDYDEEYKLQPDEEQEQPQTKGVPAKPSSAPAKESSRSAADLPSAFDKLNVAGHVNHTARALFEGYDPKDIPEYAFKAIAEADLQKVANEGQVGGHMDTLSWKLARGTQSADDQIDDSSKMRKGDLPIDYYLETMQDMPEAAKAMKQAGFKNAIEILDYSKRDLMLKFHFLEPQWRRIDKDLKKNALVEKPVEKPSRDLPRWIADSEGMITVDRDEVCALVRPQVYTTAKSSLGSSSPRGCVYASGFISLVHI